MIQNEELKKLLVEMLGLTDEDMAKVTPELEVEFLNAAPRLGRYRLVAEVVSSKYCFAGLQRGQKYVVERGQQLNTTESTAPLCLGAIAPLAEKAQVLMDRFSHKGHVTAHIRGYRCTDPGIDLGGIGGVEFKISIEEIE